MKKYLFLVILALFSISSCKLKDTDLTDPADVIDLLLLAPNGGDSLMEGSAFDIKWDGNTTALIELHYSIDNGTQWTIIEDSLANTGVYNWFPIPDRISDQCYVRVGAMDDTEADVSDATFSIVKNSNKSLLLTQPNGGEKWEAGTQQEITWYSAGIDSIKIEYTIDNGNHWNLIAVTDDNTGVFYWEPIPNTPSTLAKVRILDAEENYPSDVSDSFFEILPEPSIAVISPNGGEEWISGTSQRIEWYSENIENVKIAYTINNGFSWTVIAEQIQSNGFYNWNNIPQHNSDLCKIRVYDAEDGIPNDVSDEVFTITDQVTQSINILTPTGVEEWEAGTNQNISWEANGVTSFKVEFTTNNGSTWTTLSDSTDEFSYEWSLGQSLNSTQCKIRVSDAADGDPSDISNKFSIVPIQYINIISPVGGESYAAGDPVEIIWESSGIDYVGIDYTTTNGLATLVDPAYQTLTASSANTGSYSTSFSLPSDQYFVVVYDATDGSPSARSAGNFRVTAQVTPSITILSPNGGEEWLSSDPLNVNQYEIQWISQGVENVNIEYSLNGGSTYNTIVENIPSSGIYNWIVPETIDFRSNNSRIRIINTDNSAIFDISDAVFSIFPAEKILTWVFPNGGEYIYYPDQTNVPPLDTDTLITWHSAGIYEVDIEYTDDNGLSWFPIVNGYRSTGAYNWDLPVSPPSTQARIRIIDVSANAGTPPLSDMSEFFNLHIVSTGTQNPKLNDDNNAEKVDGKIKENKSKKEKFIE